MSNIAELRERLAALEHERWSHWMRYMFECGTFNGNGAWTMPAEKVERWQRQMNTPYADLSEREKDSDRAEASKTLGVIEDTIRDWGHQDKDKLGYFDWVQIEQK